MYLDIGAAAGVLDQKANESGFILKEYLRSKYMNSLNANIWKLLYYIYVIHSEAV